MNVFITGGTGFIGSQLALKCLERGDIVKVLGQENTDAEKENRQLIESKGAQITSGSVEDKDLLAGLMEGTDVVYHLAAAQHEMNVPDKRYYDVNVEGTRNMLEAAAVAGIKRFVHGSTIGVYGDALAGDITEHSSLKPNNIYGVTKLEGEKLVLSHKDKLPVAVIRISETYGPGDRRLLKLFKTIRKNLFFMIGNGKNIHHLIYVDDLIDGMFLAASSDTAIGRVFVLAGRDSISTNEMVSTIAQKLGAPGPRFRAPLFPFLAVATVLEFILRPLGIQPPLHRRRMDFFRKSFSFSQEEARKYLKFEPKTGFSVGVASTAKWYEDMGYL